MGAHAEARWQHRRSQQQVRFAGDDAADHRHPVPSRAVREWGVADVCRWLRGCDAGVARYAEVFKANRIDGAALLTLDEADMRDELGIAELGIRRRLSRAIGSAADAHSSPPCGGGAPAHHQPNTAAAGPPPPRQATPPRASSARLNLATLGQRRMCTEALLQDAADWRHQRGYTDTTAPQAPAVPLQGGGPTGVAGVPPAAAAHTPVRRPVSPQRGVLRHSFGAESPVEGGVGMSVSPPLCSPQHGGGVAAGGVAELHPHCLSPQHRASRCGSALARPSASPIAAGASTASPAFTAYGPYSPYSPYSAESGGGGGGGGGQLPIDVSGLSGLSTTTVLLRGERITLDIPIGMR